MTTCQFTYDDHNDCEQLVMPSTDKSSTKVWRGQVNGHQTLQAYHPTTPGTFCCYHKKLLKGMLEAKDYRHMEKSLYLMRAKFRRKEGDE